VKNTAVKHVRHAGELYSRRKHPEWDAFTYTATGRLFRNPLNKKISASLTINSVDSPS
jgi:hypothetical protein